MSFFSTNNITADPTKAAKTYTPIPEGDYDIFVERCEEKTSSKGNQMLALRFKIDGGEYDGRLLFENILLDHEKPVVVEMGQRKLHGLMLLTGVTAPKAADDFVGKAFKAKVKVFKDKSTGELKNEISFALPAAPAAATAATDTKGKTKVEGKGAKGGDW